MEASTTKEKYKRADEVMASKIDRLERKIKDLTKRGEELRETSVRYQRDRDEAEVRLEAAVRDRDWARADRDRAWEITTGLANGPRGTYEPVNTTKTAHPQEAARAVDPTRSTIWPIRRSFK